MRPDDPDHDDFSTRLAELERAKNEAIERCHHRTAIRLATELKRTAREARRLEPYVWALHTMMNNAPSVLEPEAGQEAAVELIAILESEELARQIQPDIDPGTYEWLVSRVSSCAYDGLGRSTALARGYNSAGVHETVAEGIQVCRRTGKLECVNCFRNYASDVDRAADDLDMAIHHARQVVATAKVTEDFDRRWAGASEEASLLLLAGRLDAAEAAVQQAWQYVPTYHSPIGARLKMHRLEEIIRLLSRPETATATDDAPAGLADITPPPDECPAHHFRLAIVQALRASVQGDHDAAIAILTPWDRRLTEQKCLDEWFDARLALIAAYHLGGWADRATGLVRQLETKAREARDWLSLRRLKVLLDPSIPTSPFAPAGPIVRDPTAMAQAEAPAPPTADDTTDAAGATSTPLAETIQALVVGMIQANDDPATRAQLLGTVIAFEPWLASDPTDVSQLLHLARALGDDPATGPAVWTWAEALAAPFPRHATILNALAALGDSLRSGDGSTLGEQISPERIEQLFRSSLDLDPNDAGNFSRAAVHHANAGRLSEAERCLARVLRLDRSNSRAALWLAKIYSTSDRAPDALAVLDMALRAGSSDPEIAWEAVGLAHSLGQNEALVTYLDRFEAEQPDAPWAGYYRASGLLRLARPTEALAALDEEERRNPASPLPVHLLRACAAAALADAPAVRGHLAAVLEVRLADVDYLTHTGLISLFERLWDAVVAALPADDPLLSALVERLLATGLAPNSLFEPTRRREPKAEGLTHYVCVVEQPLDARWPESPGCLRGEADWTRYRTAWGLLAASEDEAAALALAWQARCAPLAASIVEVNLRSEGFTDHPGIVWQGVRGQANERD